MLDRGNSTETTKSYRLGYRADIEGLRAAAILLVVASHAGIPWLAGGYIGVDIFFVLSGYLITGLLVQEIRSSGNIHLLAFFARRLRRLLPALLFMITCITCAAILLLPPLDHPDQAISARMATFWASNISFAFEKLEYFSPGADTNLFLHTWSLGVEEQFYLTWPFLILFFLGAFRWQGQQKKYKQLQYGMYGTILICLIFSIFLSYTKPIWGFYLMPSRAWQFALGALIFLKTTNNGESLIASTCMTASVRFRNISHVIGWFGFGLIIATSALLDRDTVYPGFWAILPSLGTALVLASGSISNCSGVHSILRLRSMQWLGRLSYSWYLWHWPVLLLGNTIDGLNTTISQLILLAISLVLAIFSYRVVESPIRYHIGLKQSPIKVFVAAITLMGCSVAVSSGWLELSESWSNDPHMRRYIEVRQDAPIIYAMGCDDWFYSAGIRLCAFGENNAKHTAVLIGDSIVGQWFPAFNSAFNKPGWRVLVLTKSSCPMVDEPWFYERIGMEYKVCESWRDSALDLLASLHPDIILMGSSSNYNFNKLQWVSGTMRILDKLAPFTGQVIIMRPTYALGFDGPSCLARQQWRSTFLEMDSDCSQKSGSQKENLIYEWLMQAARHYKNAFVLDMNGFICSENRCSAQHGDTIVYRDNMHLTAKFASTLGNPLSEMIWKHRHRD